MSGTARHAGDAGNVRSLPQPIPRGLHRALRLRLERIVKEDGALAAMQLLQAAAKRANQAPVPLTANDEELRDLAEAQARASHGPAQRASTEADALAACNRRAAQFGIVPPLANTTAGALARFGDLVWWHRRLRRRQALDIEELAQAFHLVHAQAGAYVSDATLERWRGQRQRNGALIETLEAINELGATLALEELVAHSQANPRNRRAELMVRIAGFELIADDLGHVGEFHTLTCSSRMHATLSSSGTPNPRYDGTTPRQAQAHLSGQWQKARAALSRAGVRSYGFRVAEPHHDGTPHWHLLLFMPREQVATVREVLRHYALETDGDEPGAEERRFTSIAIDKRKGSAAGYIAKYVAKNIDGFKMGEDGESRDPRAVAERVNAWASAWGIRQFQQVGGPPVSVWRELRRLAPDPAHALLDRAVCAADAGNWGAFVTLMGGTAARRREHPIRLHKPWSDRPNRYDEPAGEQIKGVEGEDFVAISRPHEWTIQRRSTAASECCDGGACGQAVRAAHGRARTRDGDGSSMAAAADSLHAPPPQCPDATPAPTEPCQSPGSTAAK